jgi:hypothetical protein
MEQEMINFLDIMPSSPLLQKLRVGTKYTFLLVVACGILTSCGNDQYSQSPTETVEALFLRLDAVKTASKATKNGASGEEAAEKLAKTKVDLGSLFLNREKAKLIMMPLAMLDSQKVEVVEEHIDGGVSSVVVEYLVVGFVGVKLEAAPKKKRITIQLTQDSGRWLISDVGGILKRYGK